uniref:Uncharacterized protein n=1 Tax=Oryzias melastigma TaxID=30732 RepID=A0A3B3BEH0_ORYME
MLHINKVSASSQAKVHPYMKRIHQHLKSLEALDFERAEGILMQSFRTPRGWIWFNVSSLDPLMLGAELVLFRKTLHPGPLSLTVTLHSTAGSQEHLSESPVLEERQLILDQRPSSGYDVFDVSAVLAVKPPELLGFQLRYTDESGSLVLHEALTQRLYSLDASSLREPLLLLLALLFSGLRCLRSFQGSAVATPPVWRFQTRVLQLPRSPLSLSPSSFLQFLSESLVFLQFLMFLLLDVTIAWYCHIHHNGFPLFFIHHYNVWLVLHYHPVRLDLEVHQDLCSLILEHFLRCFPF